LADPQLEAAYLRRRALGWGLQAPLLSPGGDHGRDLVLSSGVNGRDLALVVGVDNLAQGLALALTTLLGSDVFNVRFGFDGLNALVEETNPMIARERIRVAVIQVLRQDPRVRRVLDVKLGHEGEGQGMVDRRRLKVEVAFETVTGESVKVKLGKEVGYA
jgi:phage baseplate assembly protein W